jgi:enoyl-CoA hydratase
MVSELKLKNTIFEVKENIAFIILNRPRVMNALNEDVLTEIDQIIDRIAEDKGVRVVIITGGEKNFAAGADISRMAEASPEAARQFSFKDTFNKIENLWKPVIAAIAGYALGGGLELALACDLRIATQEAKLGLPEITLGIIPGAGGTQRLPRLICSARAKELIYTGKMIDAQTAFNYGLVNKIVAGEDLLEEATQLAKELSSRPPFALRAAKQVINNGLNMDLKTSIEFEAIAFADLFSTEDQKEGMKAFLEKRKPKFRGE